MYQIKKVWNSRQAKQIFDVKNVTLYIFSIIVLAIAWSTARTIQSNYDLQKQISVIKQQNQVLQLQNQNMNLENQYFTTDQYLDLAARQNLGLAAPGEKVFIVPKAVALKYVDPNIVKTQSVTAASIAKQSKYAKNVEDWRDFLLGRNLEVQ